MNMSKEQLNPGTKHLLSWCCWVYSLFISLDNFFWKLFRKKKTGKVVLFSCVFMWKKSLSSMLHYMRYGTALKKALLLQEKYRIMLTWISLLDSWTGSLLFPWLQFDWRSTSLSIYSISLLNLKTYNYLSNDV